MDLSQKQMYNMEMILHAGLCSLVAVDSEFVCFLTILVCDLIKIDDAQMHALIFSCALRNNWP